jgi:hypothetical protein
LAVSIANILVGAGNLYVAPKGTTHTTMTTGESYHVGATMDGVEIAYEPDYVDISVDQLKDAAIIYQNGYRVSVRTNVAEATLQILAVAWGLRGGMGVTTATDVSGSTASGSTYRLLIPIAPDDPVERSITVKGQMPSTNKGRFYYGRRAISAEASSHSLRRGEATVFPVSFRLLADPSYTGSEYGFIEDEY